jgi:hypothetical protein
MPRPTRPLEVPPLRTLPLLPPASPRTRAAATGARRPSAPLGAAGSRTAQNSSPERPSPGSPGLSRSADCIVVLNARHPSVVTEKKRRVRASSQRGPARSRSRLVHDGRGGRRHDATYPRASRRRSVVCTAVADVGLPVQRSMYRRTSPAGQSGPSRTRARATSCWNGPARRLDRHAASVAPHRDPAVSVSSGIAPVVGRSRRLFPRCGRS